MTDETDTVQSFKTRTYSVRDFEEWQERKELVLAPKFQRRDVWSNKARSYLIDTILRGKPIPKLYMRVEMNPSTRQTIREIVDGQQRLRTVLMFLEDGFPVSRAHYEELGGQRFSELSSAFQKRILQYEFAVDLLQDMPDIEVYDTFARINTYAEKLKPQELRHAKWFGEFRSSVYSLSKSLIPFFEKHKIFSEKQILRMVEAEFVSELLLAVLAGVSEGNKGTIDNAYRDFDDALANRARIETRFLAIFDLIGNVFSDGLRASRFRATRLLYPLFCALFHMQYELPKLAGARRVIHVAGYPKVRAALEEIAHEIDSLSEKGQPTERVFPADTVGFYESWEEHWVHATNRRAMAQYICGRVVKALK